MGKNDLIVALCHSAESLSEHLPTAGVRVLNPLQAQSADLSVDIILHDARTASPADDSSGVDSLLKSHPSASLIALVDDGQSVNFTSLQGGLSFRTLNVAQLKAGELPKLITSLSSVHASAGNLAHRSVLASLKSVSNPKMDRKLQVDIIEQALAEVIHLTAADFAAFYMKENSDGSAFRVMTAGNALAWPMNRTFNTSELVELAFKSEEIQQAEYVQDVDSAVGSAGTVAMECIVPMLVDQQAVGVVQIAFSQYQPNFAHLCENLQNFIAVAGVVIENGTLLLKAKRELKRTKALSELSMSLHAGGSIQSIRNSVCEWIVDNMGAASAGFIVCSEDQIVSSQMRCIAGENNPQQSEFAELDLIDQTVYQWAHDKKERVIIARGEKDPRESPLIHQMRERENLEHWFAFRC